MAEFVLHAQLAKDCIKVGDFSLCRVLLMNDASYPWFILVPRVGAVEEIHDLSVQQQQQLISESSGLASVLKDVLKGDKMNVAALGNIVSQLHIHHIVRFKNDQAWPGPIWDKYPAKAYQGDEAQELIKKITEALGDSFNPVTGVAEGRN